MKAKQEQLKELLNTLGEKKLFNGAVLAADKSGILYAGTVGLADFETGRELNNQSVFELASLSKPFTAAGIMLLQEQGKLSYDDPVQKWITDFPYPEITIRHLLHHTSGLADYMEYFIQHWDRSKIAVNQDVLDFLVHVQPPLLFQPNDQWEYSNTGYVMLAILIERVSGMSFADYLDRHFFKPRGMNRTSVFNRRHSQTRIDNYAYGYVYDSEAESYKLPDDLGETDFVIYLDGIQGDGTVNSTMEDLYRWDQAIYSGQLVSAKAWEEAYTPVKLNNGETVDYGFGWILGHDEDKGKWVTHSGGWPGYHTSMIRYVDHHLTVIFLSNTDRYFELQQQIIEAVSNILHDLPFDPGCFETTAAD